MPTSLEYLNLSILSVPKTTELFINLFYIFFFSDTGIRTQQKIASLDEGHPSKEC